MSHVTDHLTVVLKITLVAFIASSLLDMGLRLDPPDAARGLRNVRFVGLTLFWGFVVSPALAFAITRLLPLGPPYATGLLLMGVTPCAPFLPMIVERAKGDVGYTAAFMLLTSIATIIVMPFAVPLMIEGLTVKAWTIAEPLVLVALLPLAIGMVLRHVSTVLAMRLQPLVKRASSSCNRRRTGDLRCRVRSGTDQRGGEPGGSRATYLLRRDYGVALLDWLRPAARAENCPELRHGDTQSRRGTCSAILVGRCRPTGNRDGCPGPTDYGRIRAGR